jgi:hypothetical protein
LSNKALAGGKVPVGLDLGRVSHREIAVGALAELVRLRAGGELVRVCGRSDLRSPRRSTRCAAGRSMLGLHAIRWITRGHVLLLLLLLLLLLSGMRHSISRRVHCIHQIGDEVVNGMVGPRVLKESE